MIEGINLQAKEAEINVEQPIINVAEDTKSSQIDDLKITLDSFLESLSEDQKSLYNAVTDLTNLWSETLNSTDEFVPSPSPEYVDLKNYLEGVDSKYYSLLSDIKSILADQLEASEVVANEDLLNKEESSSTPTSTLEALPLQVEKEVPEIITEPTIAVESSEFSPEPIRLFNIEHLNNLPLINDKLSTIEEGVILLEDILSSYYTDNLNNETEAAESPEPLITTETAEVSDKNVVEKEPETTTIKDKDKKPLDVVVPEGFDLIHKDLQSLQLTSKTTAESKEASEKKEPQKKKEHYNWVDVLLNPDKVAKIRREDYEESHQKKLEERALAKEAKKVEKDVSALSEQSKQSEEPSLFKTDNQLVPPADTIDEVKNLPVEILPKSDSESPAVIPNTPTDTPPIVEESPLPIEVNPSIETSTEKPVGDAVATENKKETPQNFPDFNLLKDSITDLTQAFQNAIPKVDVNQNDVASPMLAVVNNINDTLSEIKNTLDEVKSAFYTTETSGESSSVFSSMSKNLMKGPPISVGNLLS